MNKNTGLLKLIMCGFLIGLIVAGTFNYMYESKYTKVNGNTVKISAVMYQEPCPDCNCYMECDFSFVTPEVKPNRYCSNCEDWK